MSKSIHIVSWNVNGIRSVAKKGFFEWLNESNIDLLGVQETKAHFHDLSKDFLEPEVYSFTAAHSAEKKGYSGVAYFAKEKDYVQSIEEGFNQELLYKAVKEVGLNEEYAQLFNIEGRVICANVEDSKGENIKIFNVYFPSGSASEERYKFKYDFYEVFLVYIKYIQVANPKIIIMGDFNTAHHEVDIARPKDNIKNSGFRPEEREQLDRLEALGFIDSFRVLNSQPENYTWWSFRTNARSRNVGWRIDYIYITEALKDQLKASYILHDVMGSDHAPHGIEINI